MLINILWYWSRFSWGNRHLPYIWEQRKLLEEWEGVRAWLKFGDILRQVLKCWGWVSQCASCGVSFHCQEGNLWEESGKQEPQVGKDWGWSAHQEQDPWASPCVSPVPCFPRGCWGPCPWAVTWTGKEEGNLGWESQRCGSAASRAISLMSYKCGPALWIASCGYVSKQRECMLCSAVFSSSFCQHMCKARESGCGVYCVKGEWRGTCTCDPVNWVKWAGRKEKIRSAWTPDRSTEYLMHFSSQKFKD